ncbi:MAG: hypothetical protein MUE97_04620, partial [Phycisphaerales bacterium]|nr:hypothetical protein [Phycisphaerales bacterium]
MNLSRAAWVLALGVVSVLATVTRGQVTITSSERFISLTSSLGTDSATNSTTGPWTRNLSVPDGQAQLLSNVSPSAINANFTYSATTLPANAEAVGFVAMQVTLTVTQTVQLT